MSSFLSGSLVAKIVIYMYIISIYQTWTLLLVNSHSLLIAGFRAGDEVTALTTGITSGEDWVRTMGAKDIHRKSLKVN